MGGRERSATPHHVHCKLQRVQFLGENFMRRLHTSRAEFSTGAEKVACVSHAWPAQAGGAAAASDRGEDSSGMRTWTSAFRPVPEYGWAAYCAG